MRFPLAFLAALLLAAPSVGASDARPSPPMSGGFEDMLCHMRASDVRVVDFLAHFARRVDAEAAGTYFDDATFEVSVRRSADGPDWVLRALYRELPSQAQLDADSERLVPLLEAAGATYPGTGCGSHYFRRSSAPAPAAPEPQGGAAYALSAEIYQDGRLLGAPALRLKAGARSTAQLSGDSLDGYFLAVAVEPAGPGSVRVSADVRTDTATMQPVVVTRLNTPAFVSVGALAMEFEVTRVQQPADRAPR